MLPFRDIETRAEAHIASRNDVSADTGAPACKRDAFSSRYAPAAATLDVSR
jgi:hypothetical protein